MRRWPVEVLRELVQIHGSRLWADAELCERLLLAHSRSAAQEIDLLVQGVRGGVPHELQRSPADQPVEWMIEPLVRRLADYQAMSARDARGVVTTWAAALRTDEPLALVPSRAARRRVNAFMSLRLLPAPSDLSTHRKLAGWMGLGAFAGLMLGALAGIGIGGGVGLLLWAAAGVAVGLVLGLLAGLVVWWHNRLLEKASIWWIIAGIIAGAGLGELIAQQQGGPVGHAWVHVGALGGAFLSIGLRQFLAGPVPAGREEEPFS